jgi:hypothetical protein
MSWRIGAFIVLFLSLAGCSTYERIFSDPGPQPAQKVERDSPADRECARVAAERADDAVMALYVSANSAEQQKIYQSTYSDCMAWHGR